MLKIFHKFFFENLNVPIPAFLTAKKFGLLKEAVVECATFAILYTTHQVSGVLVATRQRPSSLGWIFNTRKILLSNNGATSLAKLTKRRCLPPSPSSLFLIK